MRHAFINPTDPVHQTQHVGTDKTIQETFPNIINREAGHVQHIISIKTIISQFIQNDLVSRKIVQIIQFLPQLIYCQQQRGLTQLVPVRPVLPMTNRAYREQYP